MKEVDSGVDWPVQATVGDVCPSERCMIMHASLHTHHSTETLTLRGAGDISYFLINKHTHRQSHQSGSSEPN